jgi:hypothetical protein
MTIQFNTDKTINGDERHRAHFSSVISEELERFSDSLTRVEVHLSDQNGKKDSPGDIRCLLEARIEGRPPIAVSENADTLELAVSGATDKLKNALETIFERQKNY